MISRVVIAALLLLSFPALVLAGTVQSAPVQVTLNPDASGSATGNMVTARYSDNDVEHIGCGVRLWAFSDGSYQHWGFCQARDSEGVAGFCSTENETILNVMKATSDYSFITFAWDENGECIHIGFSTQSFYLPDISDKKPKK